jgi:hypothetical protein
MENKKIAEVLNKELNFNAYTATYEQKLKDKQYLNFINKYKQYDFTDICYMISNNNNYFLSQLNNINTNFLCESLLHGIYHSEKTLFFAYIICIFESLNDNDIYIICDAAKYHDIGRNSDEVDYSHGEYGARLIDQIVAHDDFYCHRSNLELLKFAIHYHCMPSDMFNVLIKYYNITNVKQAHIICDILRDADALDRVRLNPHSQYMQTNPYYLKTDYAKKLIKVAHQVNEIYVIK